MTITDTTRTEPPQARRPGREVTPQTGYSILAILAAGFAVALVVVAITCKDQVSERVTNMHFAGAFLAALVAIVASQVHEYRTKRDRRRAADAAAQP